MQKHRVALHAGACEGGSYGGHVQLEIRDVISGVVVMSINMDYATFGKLVGSNGFVGADAEVRGIEHIGKKHVSEPRSVVCNEKFDHIKGYEATGVAREQWIRDNCQEDGWQINAGLRSQNSVTRNADGSSTFRYHVFKYVEIDDEERTELLAKRDWY